MTTFTFKNAKAEIELKNMVLAEFQDFIYFEYELDLASLKDFRDIDNVFETFLAQQHFENLEFLETEIGQDYLVTKPNLENFEKGITKIIELETEIGVGK